MVKVFEYCAIFIAIVMLQALLFDHLHIATFAAVNISALFVVILPLNVEKWVVLLSSAALGVAIDATTGSPGVNTIALTFLGYIRGSMINLYLGKGEENKRGVITEKKVGSGRYLILVTTLLLIQNIILYMLDSLSFVDIYITIIRIITATLSSLFFIYIIHLPFYRGAEYNQ